MCAYMYYADNKQGLILEEDYKYTQVQGTCDQANKNATRAQVTDFIAVTPNDPNQLKKTVANGPVSVGIDAGHPVFHAYTGGIIDSTSCGVDATSHSVLIVGYGSS